MAMLNRKQSQKYNPLIVIIVVLTFVYLLASCDKATCPDPIIKPKKDTTKSSNLAIQFDGVDDYLELYLSQSIYNLQKGSVSLWLKVGDLNKTFVIAGFSNRGSGINPIVTANQPNQWFIEFAGADYSQKQIHISGLKFSNFNRTLSAKTPANSINDNNWHNIIVNSDNNANSIEVYIDGVNQPLSVFCCGGNTNDFFLADVPDLDNAKIGTIHRDTVVQTNSFTMDDFCIWNRALSPLDILLINDNPSNRPSSGLVLDYTFNTYVNLNIGNAGTNDIKDQVGTNHADALNGPNLIAH
jgi:hypothetical protein